jgi:phosphopantothenoylcysteine decarboxylase / phosphopantothenate---cysteine ligase
LLAPELVPRPPWEGRRVVLGVTGGIAAYKSVQLARDLTRLGARVDVILTRSAIRFVGPLSFEGVTGRPTFESLWSAEGAARHIRLAREADALVVAPATADVMARAAHGRADDLLTTVLLATRAPVLLAPAMNDRMWAHPQTRRNARHCSEELGYHLAGPAEGPLAVGEEETGPGRMLEPRQLVDHVGRLLGRRSWWSGRRVVVTAGPTREPLDPVRFVGNRSSGRMGFAIAAQAWTLGADVTLVTGPSPLPDPTGPSTIRVETAQEMLERVRPLAADADVLVYAAAVGDFRPASPSSRKTRKAETAGGLEIRLVENPDVAGETAPLRRSSAVAVGFALETEELVARATEKLERKGLDLIVANPAGDPEAGFEAMSNRVTLIDGWGESRSLPLMDKSMVALEILRRVEEVARGRKAEGRGADGSPAADEPAPATGDGVEAKMPGPEPFP